MTLFLGASAHAGALTGASLEFSLGTLDPLVFPADGTLTGTAVNAAQITMNESAGAFAGVETTMLVDAAPATKLSVVVNDNTAGMWSGTPLTGSDGNINGSSIVLGYGGTELIVVPFAAGSTMTQMIGGPGDPVTVAVFPAPPGWTSGTIAITGLGGATPTATAMGSVMTGTPGSVTLVAGARVTNNLQPDPTFNILRLTLDFESVPEPTMPLLFAGGAAVLGAFAWRKRQS